MSNDDKRAQDSRLRRQHRPLEPIDPDDQAFFGGYCTGKGFDMESPLEGLSVRACYALIATMHFKVVGRETHRPGGGFLDEIRCRQGKRIVGSLFNLVS